MTMTKEAVEELKKENEKLKQQIDDLEIDKKAATDAFNILLRQHRDLKAQMNKEED